MNPKNKKRSVSASLFFLLLLTTLALPAPGQEELPGALSEVIDVRVINLEAVVTYKDGVRVPGLKTEDFRLLVDGEEVPIEFFTEVRGGDALAGTTNEVTSIRDIPALVPGEPLGTSYLVFIDEFFTLDRDRDRVLRTMEEELGFIGNHDRMAVVAWDGRNLDMLTSWSQSTPALARVFEEARRRPAFGLQRFLDKNRFVSNRGSAVVARALGRRSFLDTQLDPEERAYANLLVHQLEGTVRAASSTLRSFAAPPGRKVMLVLSGGWPFMPDEFVAGDPLRSVFEWGVTAGEELYGPLVETANLLGYTLYPIDVPGLQTGNEADASRSIPPSATGFASFSRPGSTGAGFVGFLRESDLHQSLYYLASETGGRALVNGGRERPLSAVAEDTRSFYWLGFTPQWAGDDQRHEVKLEVLRPRLKLRSRNSFTDLSKHSQISMAVESALLFGNPASALPLSVEVGEPRRSRGGKIEVPLTLDIPADAVALLPNGGDYVAQLELRVAALDEDGGRSDIALVPIELRESQALPQGSSVEYETTLRLRRKPHDVVIALYDKTSGALMSALTQIGP